MNGLQRSRLCRNTFAMFRNRSPATRALSIASRSGILQARQVRGTGYAFGAGEKDRKNHLIESALGPFEDAWSVAGMPSVEYGRGYARQFADLRAGWRESALTRPG